MPLGSPAECNNNNVPCNAVAPVCEGCTQNCDQLVCTTREIRTCPAGLDFHLQGIDARCNDPQSGREYALSECTSRGIQPSRFEQDCVSFMGGGMFCTQRTCEDKPPLCLAPSYECRSDAPVNCPAGQITITPQVNRNCIATDPLTGQIRIVDRNFCDPAAHPGSDITYRDSSGNEITPTADACRSMSQQCMPQATTQCVFKNSCPGGGASYRCVDQNGNGAGGQCSNDPLWDAASGSCSQPCAGTCYFSVDVNYDEGSYATINFSNPNVADSCLSNKIASCAAQAGYRYLLGNGTDSTTSQFFSCLNSPVNLGIGGSNPVLIDSLCQPLAGPGNLQPCGDITIELISPLSLVWTGEYKDSSVLVDFPLEPGKTGIKYNWKASSDLPLLVYDPDQKGEIAEASQLFGDWTFGGKKNSSGQVEKWKDGFEPLGTLDKNQDGRITGGELDPLGLWFDANTDGISQKGEVLPVKVKGITSLAYQGASYDKTRDVIILKGGFEATEQGKARTGEIVDWYSHSVVPLQRTSKAILNVEVMPQNSSLNFPGLLAPSKGKSDVATKAGKSLPGGVWEWRGDTLVQGQVPQGYLYLNTSSDGKVAGFSLALRPVSDTTGRQMTEVTSSELIGDFTLLENGAYRLEFRLGQGAHPNGETLTTMVIEPSGQVLGRSVTRAFNERHALMKVEYGWSAKPLTR